MHTAQQNKAVIFGAGNIGRSFIGSIFASNGYRVTFIDANKQLVEQLNLRGEYPVIVKKSGQKDRRIEVSGIDALHSSQKADITEALCKCSICATSVGQGALKFVVPQLAAAAAARKNLGLPFLDIIIAENIRNGADFFREIFRAEGLNGDDAGLIETSIGKMVPIMTAADLAADPLVLNAEEYNTLILDRRGFKNSLPDFPEIKAVDNIAAWVDRKLFVHNLGHAAAAYFGYEKYPDSKLIADVINDTEIKDKVRSAMQQASAALLAEYPADFTRKDLDAHIDDLLFRFGNRALGDTVFRVGRDLYRKLNRNDRILGAAALCLKYNLPSKAILEVFTSALGFRAVDESSSMFEPDIRFHEFLADAGTAELLSTGLGLTKDDEALKNQILII